MKEKRGQLTETELTFWNLTNFSCMGLASCAWSSVNSWMGAKLSRSSNPALS